MSVFNNPSSRFGSVSMTTATLGVNDPEVGTRTIFGGNEYTFIFNGGNSQISVGLGCVLASLSSGYTATVTSVVTTDYLLGVCQHSTIATSGFGWVVSRGFAQVMASAAVAIQPSDALVLGANGFFTNIIVSASTSLPYPRVVGKCVASAASASTVGLGYFL